MMEHDWGLRDPRWAGISSDHVTVAGTRVHVLRASPASVGARTNVAEPDDADTTPMLLVHGLGGGASHWLEVMGGLATAGEVVAVDLPGFGHTRPPTARAARLLPQVNFLNRLLDQLGWDRVELHGNSMGGLITILLAGRHPDRVERLVLTSPAYPTSISATVATLDPGVAKTSIPFLVSRRLGLAAMRAMYRRTTPQEVFEHMEQLVMSPGTAMRAPVRELSIARAVDAARLPWRTESLSHATSDLLAMLGRNHARVERATDDITADILLIWGDRDRFVAQPAMDALTTRRGDIARHDLAEVGHAAMIEVPDRWLEIVGQWRDRCDAAAPAI